MARSKTSLKWLQEHFNDPYVKKAQKDGYRSRASYKLLELQDKDKLFRPGMSVIDLGAAPGGWSQVASRLIGGQGRLIASDILEMDSIPDVTFVHGDFTQDAVLAEILQAVGNSQVDLVISDMAPNMSGLPAVDMPRAMFLCELALDLAGRIQPQPAAMAQNLAAGNGLIHAEAYSFALARHLPRPDAQEKIKAL